MNFGIGNVKGAGGGSNNNSISFTRTLEATIGYEDKMCMFFANDLGDVEEHAEDGNDYYVQIESLTSGTEGQIVYALGTVSSLNYEPTEDKHKGGRIYVISSTSSVSEVWGYYKFTDENSVLRYGLKQLSRSGSHNYIRITIYPKYKQNLTGSAKSVKCHIRASLLLWDTVSNEYVAFDTGNLETSSANINNNNYAFNGTVSITFERKYVICGIQVKECYLDNLEVEAQLTE